MKRLQKYLLSERYGQLWYENELFTGVMFETDQEKKVLALNVINGLPASEYQPICAQSKTFNIALDTNSVYFEAFNEYGSDARVLYQGTSFNGVAYSFNNGICCYEGLFDENGTEDAYIYWNKEGYVINYESTTNRDGGDMANWYSSASPSPPFQLKRFLIYRRVGEEIAAISGKLDFSKDGYLTRFDSRGEFVNNYAALSRDTLFDPLKNIKDILKLKASPNEQFTLSAKDDIDDLTLAKFLDSGMFIECSSILLLHCDLNSLLMFGNSVLTPNLKELKLFKHDFYSSGPEEEKQLELDFQKRLQLVQELKRERPDLKIILGDEEVH